MVEISDDEMGQLNHEEDIDLDDSDDEEITYEQLKKRMWKDEKLIEKYKKKKNMLVKKDPEDTKAVVSRRKKMSRYLDVITKNMVKVMEVCGGQGFVYGIVPEEGKPFTGSSDSLCEWWKEKVRFDQTAPLAIGERFPTKKQGKLSETKSCMHLLIDIQDATLGSILSALMKFCVPTQRSFPLNKGLAPPWWPKGSEPWWGEQGISREHGVPPYRKPHALKKAWKVSVLAAVIKHMSNNLSRMRTIVGQSRGLQKKMTAKETKTWSIIVSQEEALMRLPHKQLKIHRQHKEKKLQGKRAKEKRERKTTKKSCENKCPESELVVGFKTGDSRTEHESKITYPEEVIVGITDSSTGNLLMDCHQVDPQPELPILAAGNIEEGLSEPDGLVMTDYDSLWRSTMECVAQVPKKDMVGSSPSILHDTEAISIWDLDYVEYEQVFEPI